MHQQGYAAMFLLSAVHNFPKFLHWITSGTWVTVATQPETIHDFGGFPQELFDVQYPAPGSEKEFSLSEIERIVLFSPNLAQVILQPASSKLTHTVYWHGKNEKDWLEFINNITSLNPSIKDSIYIRKSKWGSGEIKISTLTGSYSEILEINN